MVTSKSLNTKETSVQESSAAKTQRIVAFVCAFLILIHLVASFFPHLRLWGINQLSYFPLPFRIILTFIGILLLVPQINRIPIGFFTKNFIGIAKKLRNVNKYLKYSGVSLLSLIFFWILRARTPLLGDGYLRAGELKIGILHSVTEPLDFYLHLLISRAFGLDGYTAYGVLSCIAGALYVFLVFLICEVLGKDGKEKVFIFLILATLGANQLFFGYMESYTLMYVAMIAYLLFGTKYLKRQSGFVWPCFFFLLAASFHLATLIVLPSLFYLAFAKIPEETKLKTRRFKFTPMVSLVLVLFLCGMGLYLLKTYSPAAPTKSFLIYPFGGGESFYSFFSLAHLADFLNHQLLISPIMVVLWVMLLFLFFRAIKFKDNVVKFMVWVMVCSLVFALLVDPKLGYARDWDLFTFAGLGVTFLALYLATTIFQKQKTIELSRVTLILFVTSLTFTLPWIWVNASEVKAVARFEDLLKMDEKRAAYGYETLAYYFRDKGEHEKTVELWKKAIAINPIPRYYGMLGNAYLRLKRYDQAIETYNQALQIAPDIPSVDNLYNSLGVCLAEVGRYDEAVAQLKKAISLNPKKVEYYFHLGNILGMAGRYQEAVPYFMMSLRLDPNNLDAYKKLGMIYARMGNKEEAEKYMEVYLGSGPTEAAGIQRGIDSIQMEIEPNK